VESRSLLLTAQDQELVSQRRIFQQQMAPGLQQGNSKANPEVHPQNMPGILEEIRRKPTL